jgi:hypothetical protein
VLTARTWLRSVRERISQFIGTAASRPDWVAAILCEVLNPDRLRGLFT